MSKSKSQLQQLFQAQEMMQSELRDINLKLDYLIDIIRDELGPMKPHR